jgi:hypothetical protein
MWVARLVVYPKIRHSTVGNFGPALTRTILCPIARRFQHDESGSKPEAQEVIRKVNSAHQAKIRRGGWSKKRRPSNAGMLPKRPPNNAGNKKRRAAFYCRLLRAFLTVQFQSCLFYFQFAS